MSSKTNTPPIVSIVGASGAGKTTLLEKLIPEFTRRGFRVGTIKHDVHGFEMDQPGKDSWRHKHAGAAVTLISSPFQVGLVMDVNHDHTVDELAPLMSHVDIILTEGYKSGPKAKLEVFRREITDEPLCKRDGHLMALITDTPLDSDIPRFSPDDMGALADFLIARCHMDPSSPARKPQLQD